MNVRILSILLAVCISTAVRAQTYEQLVEQGTAAARNDSLEKAEPLYKQALRLAPKDYRNALLFTDLGRVQEALYWKNIHEKHWADDAIESYTLALGFAPASVPMLMARGLFYLRLGFWSKSAYDLSAVLDVNPLNLQARNYRAYCYSKNRDYAAAQADYTYILKRDARNYDALLGMAVMSQTAGNTEKGIEHMTALISVYPDSAELYSVRSAMYAENKQPELALLDLDKAVEMAPQNTNFILARAYLRKQQGNRTLALKDFERAVALGIPRASLVKDMKECR